MEIHPRDLTRNVPSSSAGAKNSSRTRLKAHSPRALPLALVSFARRWVAPTAVALITFELLIRSCIYGPHPKVSDPLWGRIPAPGTTWVDGNEGFGRTHWNRQGLRGRDLPHALDVPRILVLGDSFCEAAEVHDDQTFCAKLEREVSDRLQREVWVGNAGRRGLDAGDYLYYLPRYDRRIEPQLVVIAFTVNDFFLAERNVLAGRMGRLDFAAAVGHRVRYYPERESELDLLPGPLRRPASAMVGLSGLGPYTLFRMGDHFRRMGGLFRLNQPLPTATGEDQDQWGTSRRTQIATIPQMEEYFRQLLRRAHAPIACVYIHPFSPLLENRGHWEVGEERLREATAKLKIPFTATGDAFRSDFLQTGKPGNGFHRSVNGPGYGHLNADGHTVVAHTMAPMVERLIAAGFGLPRPQTVRLPMRAIAGGG